MASSKSMDFPGAKKSSYAAQVEQSQSSPYQENALSFLPVPGPSGAEGPQGRAVSYTHLTLPTNREV